jgi:hypothetical protein
VVVPVLVASQHVGAVVAANLALESLAERDLVERLAAAVGQVQAVPLVLSELGEIGRPADLLEGVPLVPMELERRRQPLAGPFRTQREAEEELATALARIGGGGSAPDRLLKAGDTSPPTLTARST